MVGTLVVTMFVPQVRAAYMGFLLLLGLRPICLLWLCFGAKVGGGDVGKQ